MKTKLRCPHCNSTHLRATEYYRSFTSYDQGPFGGFMVSMTDEGGGGELYGFDLECLDCGERISGYDGMGLLDFGENRTVYGLREVDANPAPRTKLELPKGGEDEAG